MKLISPPVTHIYGGTVLTISIVGNCLTVSITATKVKLALITKADDVAKRELFSMTPNRAFNTPCITTITPTEKERMSKYQLFIITADWNSNWSHWRAAGTF